MSKLGWFASYLRWTSGIGVFAYTASFLANLWGPSAAVNQAFVGTSIGTLIAVFMICFYPLQIGLWVLLVSLLTNPSALEIQLLIIMSCLILLCVGSLLTEWNDIREEKLWKTLTGQRL